MIRNDMSGKVCLVTGCSSGIGKVTVTELAKMGASVVMVCRNRAKGEAGDHKPSADDDPAIKDLHRRAPAL